MNEINYKTALDWITEQKQLMVEQTIELANINSGSGNLKGLENVHHKLCELFAYFNVEIDNLKMQPLEKIDDDGNIVVQQVGNALTLKKHNDAPIQVFLMGHMDTVYDQSHPFQECKWLDKNTVNGPGVADLKGGLIILLTALKALENSPFSKRIGWRVLINADEEIGSLSSSKLLKDYAAQSDFGLIFEPTFADGSLARKRKGSGNFSIFAKGRAAHAGREHHLGRNAIKAITDITSELDNLNGKRPGITINPGYIKGGGAVNIVPDKAIMRFNVRISEKDDEVWFNKKLQAILNRYKDCDGIDIRCHGKFGRKPKVANDKLNQLFNHIKLTGSQIGLDLDWQDTGGCCDGNNLAAEGLANIDTMGVVGGNIHSDKEYMDTSSLVPRAQLTALLLMKLASGEYTFLSN